MIKTPLRLDVTAEVEDLRVRLAESEEVLRAIRNGEADAVVVTGERGEQIYTLSGADRVYRQIIETMGEGTATLSADRVILYGNACLAKMLGRPLDQVLGTDLRDHLPLADQKALDAILAQARTELSRGEINLKTSAGRLVPVYLSAFCLQGEGAQMLFCIVLTDLTEQKVQELLRKNEERFQRALSATKDGIWEWDMQTNQEYFSSRWCEIIGYSFDDPEFPHTYASWESRIHPDDHDLMNRVLKDHLEKSARYDVDYRHRHKSGEYRWQNSRGQAVFDKDGKPTMMTGCISDITERKQAEEKIVLLNRALRTIRNVNELIVREKDPQKLISDACKLLVADHGYTSALLILTDAAGTPHSHALAGTEGTGKLLMAEKLRRGDFPPCCAEARTHDGVSLITDCARICAPCPLADSHPRDTKMCIGLRHAGALCGFLAVSADHPLESEEQSLFIELSDDVAFALHGIGRETAMRQSEENLRQSQKMEVVGQLAGGVAHDFNNILTAIKGYGEFVWDALPSEDPRRADVVEILSAADRAASLTRQLLAFSRRQILSPQVVDLNRIIGDTTNMLKRLIGEDIKLEAKLAVQPCLAKLDPGQTEQVIMNLVLNARDAMPHGGAITLETEIVILDEAFFAARPDLRRGPLVCLRVRDMGCGMTDEVKSHIFEPFFTTKPKGKGTGLGLATVFGIIKQSDGEIEVESAPDHGTTFRIYFPQPQLETAAAGSGTAVEDKGSRLVRGHETVLLVEDEDIVRRLGERALTAGGYTVLTAADGRKALQVLEKHAKPVDVLITDVVMPGMNGRELAQEIARRNMARRNLFISGYTDDAIVRHGVLEPGLAFLHKPCSPKVLLCKLREVLDGPADQAKA